MQRDFVIDYAKRHMLKRGEHEPIVFVETDDAMMILPVLDTRNWNTDAVGRQKVLFTLGRVFAQNEAIDPESLCSIFFVQEMWYVQRHLGDPEVTAPSQEPDRREALGIMELQIQPPDDPSKKKKLEQSFQMFDIIRSGGVIDLAQSEMISGAQSRLCSSFLAGVTSARFNDEELSKMVDRFMDVGEF